MLIRSICGLEWRVKSPSLFVFNSYDDDDDNLAVYYDSARRGWYVTDRACTKPLPYPSRDAAMTDIHTSMTRLGTAI